MYIYKARYSIESRDRIYVKGYGFSLQKIFFRPEAVSMYKLLSKAKKKKKKSVPGALKTASIRAIQKTTATADDLIWSKIADKIIRTDLQKAANKLMVSTQINEKLIRDIKKEKYI